MQFSLICFHSAVDNDVQTKVHTDGKHETTVERANPSSDVFRLGEHVEPLHEEDADREGNTTCYALKDKAKTYEQYRA